MRTGAARLGASMQVRFTQVAQGAIFAAGRSAITRTITHGPKFTLFVLYFGRSLLVCRCDRRRRHWQRLPTRRAQFTALSRRSHGQAGGTSPGPSCMPAHIRPHARGAAWQLRSHAHDRHVLYIQYETHLSSCLGRWTPLDRVAPTRFQRAAAHGRCTRFRRRRGGARRAGRSAASRSMSGSRRREHFH